MLTKIDMLEDMTEEIQKLKRTIEKVKNEVGKKEEIKKADKVIFPTQWSQETEDRNKFVIKSSLLLCLELMMCVRAGSVHNCSAQVYSTRQKFGHAF